MNNLTQRRKRIKRRWTPREGAHLPNPGTPPPPRPPSQQVMNDYLKQLYLRSSGQGSFQGIEKLIDAVRADKTYSIKAHEIQSWLQQQKSYTLNRHARKVHQRPRVMVSGQDDQFDTDLADLSQYADDNDGIHFLLVVIDIFTRFLWVEPLENKFSNTVVAAMKRIFARSKRIPRRIRSDKGAEFFAQNTQRFYKSKNIHPIYTHNELQANYVERVIKTLKTKIKRFQQQYHTNRYIDDLQDLVDSYNNTWHHGIRAVPRTITDNQERRLWWQMYWPKKPFQPSKVKQMTSKVKYRFEIGQKVRIKFTRSAFQREYDQRWSREFFTISRRFPRQNIPMYKLKDEKEEPVEGTFYQNELQAIQVSDDDEYLIEKVIRRQKRGGRNMALVKFLGWPKKFNEWIPETQITKIVGTPP